MKQNNEQTKWSQFLSLVVVFFFWGFVAASNDILIPVFKKWFVLSQLESQLVAWAFYVAYFVGSVIFFVISLKSDILQKFGYKKTLAFGLSISAIGAFLFYPAAAMASFWFFLAALFIVGLGFSVQQIVANPLAIKMGDPKTGSHRLTLAGGINSLGTTIGPILVGLLLFGSNSSTETMPENLTKLEVIAYEYNTHKNELKENLKDLNESPDASDDKNMVIAKVNQQISLLDAGITTIGNQKTNDVTIVNQHAAVLDEIKLESSKIKYPLHFVQNHLKLVQLPFIGLGIAFILVAIFMLYSKIEDPVKEALKEENSKIETEDKFNILKYPQLILGMLALFLYVGVEVSIISNLPALLHTREFGSILESNIAPFVSLYWGSLMIGRWNGGINVFNTSKTTTIALKIIVPLIAFAVIIFANSISGKDVTSFYIYPIWIAIFIIMSFVGGTNPARSLMIFGIAGAVMMVCGLIYPDKEVAMYFFISGGLFCSIMWPSIFDLAIAGLGKNTGKASSFLIMMILGGGIIPLLQGWICDFDTNTNYKDGIMGISYTHFSYIIPALCFIYVAFYGFITPKILKKQGINLENNEQTNTH